MCDIDFGRSFVRFRSTRVNHTPRLALHSRCTLTVRGQAPKTFYLSAPCLGETMYAPRDLVHQPPSEFVIILAPNDQFLMIKRMASCAEDVRSAHRVGEAMPTHSGAPATVTDLEAHVTTHRRVTPIADYASFRDALLGHHVVTARTTYELDDVHVVVEYPGSTLNVAHDREAWQVDAGPVLVPSEPKVGPLEVSRFNVGFLVYNQFDWAELAVRAPTPVSGDARTLHYSRVQRLNCRNELFRCQ